MDNKIKEQVYYVSGMHCASCEILIEKKLLQLPKIKSVEATVGKGEVMIEYEGEKPSCEKLNMLFKEEGYIFSADKKEEKGSFNFSTIFIGLIVIFIFLGLWKSGLSDLINVNSTSSLPMFFGFGLIAGISSCAALVGGLILSMSKQWTELYSTNAGFSQKIQPHLMFNIGRILSYAFFGAILGIIGSKLSFSLNFGSILVLAVSVLMIILSLQMFGFRSFQRFQFSMPKFLTRYAADESNFKSRYAPFLLGAFTFFLPCGFTITAQGLALVSGNAIQGALIMFFFALGTLPMLLLIGFSSVKFSQKPHLSEKFLKVAAMVVLFFALFNINYQLNVLGYTSLSDLKIGNPSSAQNSLLKNSADTAPIVDGKQVLKMTASSSGYSPNYFKVKAGIPVKWEITDIGTSGCTNAVISKNLFAGEIELTPGKTSIKEFTPQKAGKYKFSCWMGMISGIIEVVDENYASSDNISDNAGTAFALSGAENSGGKCGMSGLCGCMGE